MSTPARIVSLLVVTIAIIATVRYAASTPAPPDVTNRDNISFVQSVLPSPDKNFGSDFSWVDKSGKKVSLKDLQGKVVFINFWATWCRPCKMELPDIVTLTREYEGDVVFIGIAMERPGNGDPLQNLVNFTKEQKMTYQIVVGNDQIANAYGGLSGIPTTFLLDKKGKILDKFVGMRNYAQFKDMITKAL